MIVAHMYEVHMRFFEQFVEDARFLNSLLKKKKMLALCLFV